LRAVTNQFGFGGESFKGKAGVRVRVRWSGRFFVLGDMAVGGVGVSGILGGGRWRGFAKVSSEFGGQVTKREAGRLLSREAFAYSRFAGKEEDAGTMREDGERDGKAEETHPAGEYKASSEKGAEKKKVFRLFLGKRGKGNGEGSFWCHR